MREKTALINADELPTDVAGGEALLDRHQQHKVWDPRDWGWDHKNGAWGTRRMGHGVWGNGTLRHHSFCLSNVSYGHSTSWTLTMTDFNLRKRLPRNCWTLVMKHLRKFRRRWVS